MAKDVTVKLVSAVVLVIGVMFSGCVTTTDSRFSREADRQKALNNYVQLATAILVREIWIVPVTTWSGR